MPPILPLISAILGQDDVARFLYPDHLELYDSSGSLVGRFMVPGYSLASGDQSGRHILVSNSDLALYSPSGAAVWVRPHGQAAQPTSLAVWPDGSSAVAFNSLNLVLLSDALGNSTGSLSVPSPSSLSLDAAGQLHVFSQTSPNGQISVFNGLVQQGPSRTLPVFCTSVIWLPTQNAYLASLATGQVALLNPDLSPGACARNASSMRLSSNAVGYLSMDANFQANLLTVREFMSCSLDFSPTVTPSATPTSTLSPTFSISPTFTSSFTISPTLTPMNSCCSPLPLQSLGGSTAAMYDLEAASDGSLYLLDRNLRRLYHRTGSGLTLLASWSGPSQPVSLALDEAGQRALVASATEGLYSVPFTGGASSLTRTGRPFAVAVDPARGRYYLLDGPVLHRYDLSSTAEILPPFQFVLNPCSALAVAPDGSVWGTPFSGGLLRVDFNALSSTTYATGSPSADGVGRGMDLAVRPDGVVVVADFASSRVKLYNSQGIYLCDLLPGAGQASFIDPAGVALLNGQVVVSDNPDRLFSFDCGAAFTPTSTFTATPVLSPTPSATASVTASFTASATASPSFTISPTFSITPIPACDDCGQGMNLYPLANGNRSPFFFPPPNPAPNMGSLGLIQGSQPLMAYPAGKNPVPLGALGGFVLGAALDVLPAAPTAEGSVALRVVLYNGPEAPTGEQVLMDWARGSSRVRLSAFGPSTDTAKAGSFLLRYSTAGGMVQWQSPAGVLPLGPYSHRLPAGTDVSNASYANLRVNIQACGLGLSWDGRTGYAQPQLLLRDFADDPSQSPAWWWFIGNAQSLDQGLDGLLGPLDFRYCSTASFLPPATPTPSYTASPIVSATATPTLSATTSPSSTPTPGGPTCAFCNTLVGSYPLRADLLANSGPGASLSWAGAGAPIFTKNALGGFAPSLASLLLPGPGLAGDDGTVAFAFALDPAASGGAEVLYDSQVNGAEVRLRLFTKNHPNFGRLGLSVSGQGPEQISALGLYAPSASNLSGGPYLDILSDPQTRIVAVVRDHCSVRVLIGPVGGTLGLVFDSPLPTPAGASGTGQRVGWDQAGGSPLEALVSSLTLYDCPTLGSPTPTLTSTATATPAGGVLGARLAAKSTAVVPTTALLLIAPNPLVGQGLLRAGLPQAARARVLIADLNGRVVWAQDLGALDAGIQDLALDLSGKAPGIYLAVLESDSGEGWQAAARFKLALVR
jgi:hypothetical protein